jgi:hypothetical protein
MRLPFLQLESDLLAHGAAGVAALLGCSVPQALGHIALLRAWAVSRGPADAPPDGWVPGDNAARLVAAGAQWTGDAGAFIAALGDPGVELLEVHRDGIQVLGMRPYAEAWERNDKARERLRRFRERNANEARTSPDVSGQTQTQTQTQTQKAEDLPPPASAAPREELRLEPQQAARRAALKKPKPEKPTDPRHAPLTQDLVSAGWTHHGGRTAKAVADLLALANQHCLVHGGDVPGEVKRRAAIAMAHEGFPRVREIHELVPNWGHFAEVPRRAGGGPAPPSSWDLSKELPPPSPEDDTVPL